MPTSSGTPQRFPKALCIAINFRLVALSPRERALAEFAEKITNASRGVSDAHFDALRLVPLTDEAIFRAIEIAAAYNGTARVENALGLLPSVVLWSSVSSDDISL